VGDMKGRVVASDRATGSIDPQGGGKKGLEVRKIKTIKGGLKKLGGQVEKAP